MRKLEKIRKLVYYGTVISLGILMGSLVEILLFGGIAVLNGFVLSVLWGWFIVPTFEAPAIGIIPAIGIALAIGYLIDHTIHFKKGQKFSEVVLSVALPFFMRPLMLLFSGWILHLFM